MLGGVLSLLALTGSPPPGDEPRPVGERLSLQWSAPAGCPEEAEVRDAIDRYLGRDDFGRAIDDVKVSGHITRMPQAIWRLTTAVTLPAAVVDRTVDADHCADLANAAGLMIAVALDPLRVSRQVVPVEEIPEPPHPTLDDVVEQAPAPPAASDTPGMPDAGRRWSLELRAGAAGEIGTTPKLRGGAWLAVALVLERVRVEASGQYWFPRALRPFAEAPGAGASVQQGGAALRACYVPSVRRVEFPSCLSVEAGQMRARGIGLDEARVSRRPWVALVVGQEITFISRRHLGAWLGVDAIVNVVRPRLHVDDLGPVVATRVVGFRCVGGPAVRF